MTSAASLRMDSDTAKHFCHESKIWTKIRKTAHFRPPTIPEKIHYNDSYQLWAQVLTFPTTPVCSLIHFQDILHEMTKITISNQSRKSKTKYKSENGRTRTSKYIRGGIRCHGGVSIPCWPVTPAVNPISTFDRRYHP
jgi:hypothetical protein